MSDSNGQTVEDIVWLHRNRPGNYTISVLRKRRCMLVTSVAGFRIQMISVRWHVFLELSLCSDDVSINLLFLKELPSARKLAKVIYRALLKIDPKLANQLRCDVTQHNDKVKVNCPRPPLNRQNAFVVEKDSDASGSKSGIAVS